MPLFLGDHEALQIYSYFSKTILVPNGPWLRPHYILAPRAVPRYVPQNIAMLGRANLMHLRLASIPHEPELEISTHSITASPSRTMTRLAQAPTPRIATRGRPSSSPTYTSHPHICTPRPRRPAASDTWTAARDGRPELSGLERSENSSACA